MPKAKQPPARRASGGLEAVNGNLRELFWGRRLTAKALGASVLVIGLQSLIILVLIASRPAPVYFAATPDLRIMQLKPLSEPVMSPAGLQAWVTQTIAATMGLNFTTYRRTLNSVRDNYSIQAFASIIQSLKTGGTIEVITTKRLSSSVAIDKAPVLLGTWENNGQRYWRMQFPLTLSFANSSGVLTTQKLMATVVVRRVPATEKPRGVEIAQVVIASAGGGG